MAESPCPCTASVPCAEAYGYWLELRGLPVDGTEERAEARRQVARAYTRHLVRGRERLFARLGLSVLWPVWPEDQTQETP